MIPTAGQQQQHCYQYRQQQHHHSNDLVQSIREVLDKESDLNSVSRKANSQFGYGNCLFVLLLLLLLLLLGVHQRHVSGHCRSLQVHSRIP
jgi:hypothetical protein